MASPDMQVKVFTESLRRVLYLAQIFRYNLDSLKDCTLTPSHVKYGINGVHNSINRFISDMEARATPDTVNKVRMDLQRDQLYDVSLLLDAVADLADVEQVVRVINESKAIQKYGCPSNEYN